MIENSLNIELPGESISNEMREQLLRTLWFLCPDKYMSKTEDDPMYLLRVILYYHVTTTREIYRNKQTDAVGEYT